MRRLEDGPDVDARLTGPDPWPLWQRPGFLMRRLHQIHVSLFAEACASFETTPLQYSVMSALADRGAADQTTLAVAVALDRTTTTGIVKRLQARGLIARATSPRDKRAQTCTLTPEGRALLQAMEASARRAHEATVASLDPEQRRTLLALMSRVVEAHQASSDREVPDGDA